MRKAMRCIGVLAVVLALAGGRAWAADHAFSVLIDADANPATGCTVPTSKGAFTGVEQVLTTTVTTSPSDVRVTRVTRRACVDGALGAPVVQDSGGWPVGLGIGVGGSGVIETSIPLAALGASAGSVRVAVISLDADGGQDAMIGVAGAGYSI